MIKNLLFIVFTCLFFTCLKQDSIAQTTITMQKEGGVFFVPCTVNGLKLRFIFDTGASSVSISLTEAKFMLKNDYLKSEDILGKQYFTDATGDISVGTKIILRKIQFAGLTLLNVEASVVNESNAPLLLGQSAMAKLGKFQIDPSNGTLTIINGPNKSVNYSQNTTRNSSNNNNNITGSFTDTRDNQTYKWVKIGTQIWMAENLNYYNSSGCWCYDNKTINCDVYGRLYNWETAKNVCPAGWHLPSDAEWTVLTDYLGGKLVAGGKMKETGTTHWNSPNDGAENSSGFTALPGGCRNNPGTFYILGYYGGWWSTTEYDAALALSRNLTYNYADAYRNNNDKNSGFSVRCVRD